jgi:hypothetical protein
MIRTSFAPRRSSDRRIRRRAFKSVYQFTPVEPPFIYFLTTAQTASAYGITEDSLSADRKSWERDGTGNFAPPVLMDDHTWRYRRDSVTCAEPGNEFIDIMRRERHAWIESDKLKSRTTSAS